MGQITDRQARHQRLRLQRQWMSGAIYALWTVTAITACQMGFIDSPGNIICAIAMTALVVEAGFALSFVKDWNLRFVDPSLTLPRCIVAISWLILLSWFAPEWRDILIIAMPVIVMFGIFQLRPATIALLAGLALGGYAAVWIIDFGLGRTQLPAGAIGTRLSIAAGLMIWCVYFSNHVARLRSRLHARNHELEDVLGEMTQLAERDELTQAFNRRRIIDSLGRLREAAIRHADAFSVVIIDLDLFKRINDQFGHLTGDAVLSDFAQRVRSELRLLDELSPVGGSRVLGRYGGEEFIVILPHTALDGAEDCAERIRRCTAAQTFQKELTVTISAGVAQFNRLESIDSLLRRADKALYAAKEAGRNCVRTAEPYSITDQARSVEVVALADYQSEG
ncbi:MAG: GGDEF domain-containing protein [Pseudomonadota bacterium]